MLELIVVLSIIAVLASLAVVFFGGVTSRSDDARADVELRYLAEQSYKSMRLRNTGTYEQADVESAAASMTRAHGASVTAAGAFTVVWDGPATSGTEVSAALSADRTQVGLALGAGADGCTGLVVDAAGGQGETLDICDATLVPFAAAGDGGGPTPPPPPPTTTPATTTTTAPAAPAAPTGVTATPASGSVTIAWNAHANATGHRIFRDGDLVRDQQGTTSWVDGDVTNGVTYTYTVRAYNATGPSPHSAPVTATPQVASPSTPTGLTATAGNNQVTVSWNAVSGATGYRVFRNGTQVHQTTATTWTSTGLSAGTTYSFTVAAYNSGGQSAATSPATATPTAPPPTTTTTTAPPPTTTTTAPPPTTTQPPPTTTTTTAPPPTTTAPPPTTTQPAPATPTGLTATAGNAQVTVSWNAVSGATGYRVFRNGTQVHQTTATTWASTGLTNGTSYSFTVTAYNTTGSSSATGAVAATPQPPAPAAPTGLSATAGNAQVAVSWNAVSGATGYRVFRNGTQVHQTTATTWTSTGLTNGTSYSFTVAAYNGGGQSAPSEAVTATPQPPAPVAPTGLNGSPGDTTAALSWNAVADATGYRIFRDGTQIRQQAQTSFTDTGLTNGATYSYSVAAYNLGGQSTSTTAVEVTPQAPVPAVPSGLTVTPGIGQLTVTWDAVTDTTGYRVFRDGTLVRQQSETTWTDTAVTAGSTYSYTVATYNIAGQSDQSAPVSGTPLGAVPGAPTSVAVLTGTGTVRLTWGSAPDASSYTVTRNGIEVYVGSDLTFTDTGLTNGTASTYEIRGVNASGSGPAATTSATPVARSSTRYLRTGTGSSCAPGSLAMADSAGTSGTTASTASAAVWSMVLDPGTYLPGTWSLAADHQVAGGGGQPNRAAVTVERYNAACQLVQTLVTGDTGNLTAGTSTEIAVTGTQGELVVGAGDVVVVRVVRSNGGRSQSVAYNGAAGTAADSRLEHPSRLAAP